MHNGLVRVRFKLDPSDWHGHASENIWAEPIEGSDSGDIFRLKNSPFFARGISLMDLIRAIPSEDSNDALEAVAIVEQSGHSNYMIICKGNRDKFNQYWMKLENLGCSYESGTINFGNGDELLYAVDVPPSSDIFKVYDVLLDGEVKGIWVFQEGAVGHDVKPARPKSGGR